MQFHANIKISSLRPFQSFSHLLPLIRCCKCQLQNKVKRQHRMKTTPCILQATVAQEKSLSNPSIKRCVRYNHLAAISEPRVTSDSFPASPEVYAFQKLFFRYCCVLL